MINKIKNNPFAKNSLILFIGTMVNNVLNYVFHLVVGRMVSVSVYGETESLISLMTITAVPAAALVLVITKYAAESKAHDDKKRSYELLRYFNKKIASYGIVVFFAALAFTPQISRFMNLDSNIPLAIVWCSMLLSLFSAGTSGMLNGWQLFKATGWSLIGGGGLKLISALAFIALGFGVNGLMFSFFLSAVATYVIALFSLRFIFKEGGYKGSHHMSSLDFGPVKNTVMTFLLGNLAITVLGNVDMVIAKHNLTDFEAGQYGALTIISKIIFFATGVMSTVLFSMSAENNHKKGDTGKLFRNAFYLVFGVSSFSAAAYFLAPRLILSILFGSKYNAVSSYLGWFAIMVALFSLVNLTFQYLLSLHRVKVVYGLMTVAVASSAAILFLGHSISAILIISSLSQVLALAVSLPFVFKSMKEKKPA
ncbi:MAG: hypothetical protein HGB08_02205 [Candidatus Moranbacteria bacterium]|nr:hypothetical protein [Candidatus Moranbacteria bacterium]